ncbi:hypothetical protein F2P56_014481, partial [Juglans regia]
GSNPFFFSDLDHSPSFADPSIPTRFLSQPEKSFIFTTTLIPSTNQMHSCTVSFAFAGSAFFMIRLTFAIDKNRSCSLGDNSLADAFPALSLPPLDSLSESS